MMTEKQMGGRKYKIRFHLGRGENYMKWQIQHPDNPTEYHVAEGVWLVMTNCKLYNRPNVAANIHRGANKTVCAWVECESVEAFTTPILKGTKDVHLAFNPRVNMFWNIDGENVDNAEYEMLYTYQRRVYLPENKFGGVE